MTNHKDANSSSNSTDESVDSGKVGSEEASSTVNSEPQSVESPIEGVSTLSDLAEDSLEGFGSDITLEDNEDIIHSVSELSPILENDRSYFILGNYDRDTIRHLNLVAFRLNRRPDAYAFRMVDIRGKWDNLIYKFRLIADLSTYLIGVAEKEGSGFDTEAGILTQEEYFPKSHILKRELDEDSFNAMLESLFDIFEDVGRLYHWQNEEQLASKTGDLP